jgi:hypothetical protein
MLKQTIELKSFNPDNSNDLSTTRQPLVKKTLDETKVSNIQLKIERQFRKLNSISSLKKVMIFIYECLFIDVLINIYHAYELITALTDITKASLSLIYFVEYAVSLWNAVLYLKIIINYGDYKKEVDRKREL